MAGGGQSGISVGIGALALNLVSALVLVAIAWGAFKGSSEAQYQALQKQVDRLEARVERLANGGRQ
jgi:hypothetical protein